MKRVFTALILMCALLCFGSTVGRAQTGQLSDLDALRYIASHPDLIAAFGTDAAKGRAHYEQWGIKEGRKITFEPLNYTASHADLIGAFGVDETKSVRHFIQFGFKEGRQTTFNPLRYIASHPDLIDAFGADGAKGARHYIEFGFKESRKVTFDPLRYTASHPDLVAAFGGDEAKATTHYIQFGYKEKRQTTFSDLDALQYVASFADLIQSVGTDVVTAIRHYVSSGYSEGRRIVFDALAYIASYGDLMQAFGTDAVAGAKHYISFGYKEGRRVIFDAAGYLATHADLQQVFGSDTVAATRHYINWGFKEKRSYAFTVTVITSGEGSASNSRLYVNAGERATIKLTPGNGSYIATASGCGGSLSGDTYTTSPISGACQVRVGFNTKFGAISGVVRAIDASRPAFVTLVSADDDSVLQSAQLDASGQFEFVNLDGRKKYYVDVEQSGVRPSSARITYGAQQLSGKTGLSLLDKASQFFGVPITETVRPFAVESEIGDRIEFDATPVPGLSEGEYRFSWAANGTPTGEVYSSRVAKPITVEKLSDQANLPDSGAAVRLAQEFGIVLVNPDSVTQATSGGSQPTLQVSDQRYWTDAYADRLYQLLKGLAIPRYPGSVRVSTPGELKPGEWIAAPTYVALTGRDLQSDVAALTPNYKGGKVVFSAAAFANATPNLVRVEGKRGTYFSSRLWRAVLRFASENGTDFQFLKATMKSRYGVVIAAPGENPLVTTPVGCAVFPTECSPSSWRAFSSEELLLLMSVYEEFPDPLKDISNPTGRNGLRYILRRQDGTVNPGNTKAAAAYAVPNNYIEYMDAVFSDPDRSNAYRIHAHEKAHAIWSTVLDARTRLDWLRLSGWYNNPRANGGNVGADGKCEEWKRDPNAWVPPQLSSADLDFLFGVAHDKSQSDIDQLKVGWASCDTENFVSPYSRTNPNEDFAEAFGNFMFNPDLIRARAPNKYAFIRDRLMQGTVYLSKIREDLTFEVLNLYPDQSYPGAIKKVDVLVKGSPDEDKELTIRLEVAVDKGCKAASPGCFSAVRDSKIRASARYLGPYDNEIGMVLSAVSDSVLEGKTRVSKYKPAGWYSVGAITVTDRNNNSRSYTQASQQFAMKIYVDNRNEDVTSASYVKGSASFQFVSRGHPDAQSDLPADERELIASWRVNKRVAPVTSCSASAVLAARTSTADVGKAGSFDALRLFGFPVTLPAGQVDGATHRCIARYRVSKFLPSGEYQLISTRTDDDGGNVLDVRYSGSDTSLEPLLKASFASEFSDEFAPSLNIQRCTTNSASENCLRISSAPTNPNQPNGETLVTLSYYAFEEQSLSRASGFSKAFFQLRDPRGRVFGYIVNCPHRGQPEFTGVDGRCPLWPYENFSNDSATLGGIKAVFFNRVFKCPASAGAPCDATTPVQYQARVLLPPGSTAGTWGLTGMTLYDHAENFRSYDFTELFKFQPFASSSKKAAQASSNVSPLTFEVIATQTGASAVKQLAIPEPQIGEVPSIFSAWSRMTGNFLSSRSSRATDWFANRISEAVRLVDQWVSPTVAGGLTNLWQEPARDVTAMSSRLDNAAAVVSQGEDPLTGSRYRVIRTLGSSDSQQWTLEYRSNAGALFATRNLPTTSEVLWRGRLENAHLSTAAWTRVCADRVWTVQDGYELLFHVGDRALQELRPGRLWVDQSAETSVLTHVRCTFGGAIWVEGYAFGVSGDEPPLRRSDVQATRFGFALDRFGGLIKREVQVAPFNLTQHCIAAANEQQMFCEDAKRVLGW